MIDNKKVRSKQKKRKREEELLKKKLGDKAIKLACMKNIDLVDFPSFKYYECNGISAILESSTGEVLTDALKNYIQDLLKVNMEGLYGSEWPDEEKTKREDMIAPEARYIIVRLNGSLSCSFLSNEGLWSGTGSRVVGFAHYRFVVEEDVPVLYVYELQLEKYVQGKGLGEFLMQLLELIAHKNNMKAVMLTVQKKNLTAIRFYQQKLRYLISSISPSRVDPEEFIDCTYEILCKTFDVDARAILEI